MKTKPYHEENVSLSRSIDGKQLIMNIVMTEDNGEAIMKARIYFPHSYKSDLESAIRNDNREIGVTNEPALLQLDMSFIRTSSKRKPYMLWLGSFYVRPALTHYKDIATKQEQASTKGIGKVALCHAMRVWMKWGPKLWSFFPPADELYIGLRAESDLGQRSTDKFNMLHRAFYSLGIRSGTAGHTKLIDYYKSLGFSVTQHTLTGTTPMVGRAIDVVNRVCDQSQFKFK